MRIWRSEEEFDLASSSLALGMFDGVHVGHQRLIRHARRLADSLGAACVVSTFDRHPLSVLFPERAPVQLITLEEKLDRFERLGVDGVLIRPFTPEFAAMDPDAYLEMLKHCMRVRALVAGFNYTFGKQGRGDAALICSRAEELGYLAEIVAPVKDGEDTVSSTLIRTLLKNGDTARAARLMELKT